MAWGGVSSPVFRTCSRRLTSRASRIWSSSICSSAVKDSSETPLIERARRDVPVQHRFLAEGFLELVEAQQSDGSGRP